MQNMLSWIVQIVQLRIPAPALRSASQLSGGLPRLVSWARFGHFPRIISTQSRFCGEGQAARETFLSDLFSTSALSLQHQVNVQQARPWPAYQQGQSLHHRPHWPESLFSNGLAYQT